MDDGNDSKIETTNQSTATKAGVDVRPNSLVAHSASNCHLEVAREKNEYPE